MPQDVADLMAAAKVWRQFRIGVVAQSAHVNDPLDPRILCRTPEGGRSRAVLLLEVVRSSHQVDEIVSDLHARQAAGQRCLIEHVSRHDLGRRCNTWPQLLRVTSEAAQQYRL